MWGSSKHGFRRAASQQYGESLACFNLPDSCISVLSVMHDLSVFRPDISVRIWAGFSFWETPSRSFPAALRIYHYDSGKIPKNEKESHYACTRIIVRSRPRAAHQGRRLVRGRRHRPCPAVPHPRDHRGCHRGVHRHHIAGGDGVRYRRTERSGRHVLRQRHRLHYLQYVSHSRHHPGRPSRPRGCAVHEEAGDFLLRCRRRLLLRRLRDGGVHPAAGHRAAGDVCLLHGRHRPSGHQNPRSPGRGTPRGRHVRPSVEGTAASDRGCGGDCRGREPAGGQRHHHRQGAGRAGDGHCPDLRRSRHQPA